MANMTVFFIPCMPTAQLASSTSAPALPDEASLLCGDRGTWLTESPADTPSTDKRHDDDGGFLSAPNLTLRWTQSGTDDADNEEDEDTAFECVAGSVMTLCSCWCPWTTHKHVRRTGTRLSFDVPSPENPCKYPQKSYIAGN